MVNCILICLFTDEDRLSKRKSIGETISLQGEVESRNSPEKEEVGILYPTWYNVFYLGIMNNFLRFLLVLFQRTPAEAITFETLKNAIGMTEQWLFLFPPFVKYVWSFYACCVSPSSGQCWYGGAGTRAEETSGGEISKGSFRGNSGPLRCKGTTNTLFFFFSNWF